MIHIPTGPIKPSYARMASVALGLLAAVTSYYRPEFLPAVTSVTKWLLPLGITVGRS